MGETVSLILRIFGMKIAIVFMIEWYFVILIYKSNRISKDKWILIK